MIVNTNQKQQAAAAGSSGGTPAAGGSGSGGERLLPGVWTALHTALASKEGALRAGLAEMPKVDAVAWVPTTVTDVAIWPPSA